MRKTTKKIFKKIKKILAFTFYLWYYILAREVQICDDAGGGRLKDGKFPRSMSDFKPGDRYMSNTSALCHNAPVFT